MSKNPEYWCFCGYYGDETGPDYCVHCGEEFGEGETCQHCGSDEYESSCPDCGRTETFGHWDTGPIEMRPIPKEKKDC